MSDVLLELRDVKTHFPVRKGFLFGKTVGMVKAVDGVSLQVKEGDILGLVGESGCGKSTLARSILDLVPATSGTVLLNGESVQAMSSSELRAARRTAQMVFQDPHASLNPRMTVYTTLAEPMLWRKSVLRRAS
jgi:oligopeptide transport system ATP-binding protein